MEEAEDESQVADSEPAQTAGEVIRGLVILPGSPRAGEAFAVDRELTTIGRAPEADVFLDDLSVSREHAQVVRAPEGTYIEDLGSRNGTYVNRRRVESQWLADGDEIRIGAYTFSYLERA